jgi:hypothetical protein
MESMTLTSGVAKVKIGGTSVRVVAATTKDVTLVDLDELYPEKHLRYIGMPVTEAPNGATVEAFATEVYGEGESQRITGFFFAGGVQFRAKLKTQHSDSEVIGKTISNKDGLVMVGSICLAQPPMRKATDIEEDFDTEILSITVQQKKSSKTGQSFDAISVVTGIGALWGLGRDVENKLKSMQSKSGLRLVKKGNAIYLSSPSMLSKYASLSPTSV